MGRKYASKEKQSEPHTCDELLTSFQLRLQRKYGGEIVEPLPDKVIELLFRLEHINSRD